MSNPLVSIIIPVYNAGSTIARTLESVIDQSYQSVELVVVDGASSDGSLEIISRFQSYIKVFISEQDTGVYAAINKGLDRASGDWILILGADDFLANSSVLQNCFRDLPEKCNLIFGDVINVGSTHALVPNRYHNKLSRNLYWKNTIHQQGVFYHRDAFKAFRFNES